MTPKDKKEFKELFTDALMSFWESVSPLLATKEDLMTLATKDDLRILEHQVDDLSRDVKDIRRRVIDLETDTPTKSEFNALKTKVSDLTN